MQLLSREFRSGIRQRLSWKFFFFTLKYSWLLMAWEFAIYKSKFQSFIFKSSCLVRCTLFILKTEEHFYLECDTELFLDNTECESYKSLCWWCWCSFSNEDELLEEKMHDFRRGCIALKRFAWEEMLRDFTGGRYTFGEIVWPREERLVDLSVSLSRFLQKRFSW